MGKEERLGGLVGLEDGADDEGWLVGASTIWIGAMTTLRVRDAAMPSRASPVVRASTARSSATRIRLSEKEPELIALFISDERKLVSESAEEKALP